MADPRRSPDARRNTRPRWVKVAGLIAVVLVALAVIVALLGGGEHGPGRHLPGGHSLGVTSGQFYPLK